VRNLGSKEGEKVVLFPKPKLTWDEYFATAEAFPDFDVEREGAAQPPHVE
jgi:hypothetical protein